MTNKLPKHKEDHIGVSTLENCLSGRSTLHPKHFGVHHGTKWSFSKTPLIKLGVLTCEVKVVCFLKIWWRFNEALLSYLEVITIGMKPTLMKERRFDGIHVDQGRNVCSPHSYIIKKVYLKFVIQIVDLVPLIWCIWSFVCLLICWMFFQQVKMSLLVYWMVFQQIKRLVVVVLNYNKFNQLIYFLIN